MKFFIAFILLVTAIVFVIFMVAFIEFIWKLDVQQLRRLCSHRDRKIQLMPRLKKKEKVNVS